MRPDIAYIVALFSQYFVKPLSKHLMQALRCIGYLNTMRHLALTYQRHGGNNVIQGYCDADYANDTDNQKSQGGRVFIVNGGAVSWRSKKQGVVSTSTYEAEYISCSEVGREAKGLYLLSGKLKEDVNTTIILKTDHQGALSYIIGNADLSERSKSIDVCYHNSRELYRSKEITYDRVPSADNPADLFTKALPLPAHRKFMEIIGLRDIRHIRQQ
jgi:hypothetical protein